MKVELFPFQKKATSELRMKVAEALNGYRRINTPQVVSLQAPTGSGKTIIMASLIEDIFSGTDMYEEQPEAVFVWLSDSPSLNVQSKQKIESMADKIRFGKCQMIEDESFDKEMLEDGYIYFLNTQKLGKAGNLSYHSDNRQYTIWETLENTAKNKSDHLYFIIDEAHRGMQGRSAGEATSIMQRFLKGSPAHKLSPMPLVIGMSATAARFNALVGETISTLQKCVISPNDVRSSGLLKDRIIITYPADSSKNNDMAILQAATNEWKDKCQHWHQYSDEQHYAQVNPVFVIQVLAGNDEITSETNLNDVISKIEETMGTRFKEHEVIHTFGSTSDLIINGLTVHYTNPSDITDDKRIKVVLFKENLSTGWDCPRAETMMSFRHAEDVTYIAQLLGRMIRTPLQCHILVDESLNDVRLYLPYFNIYTVQEVIDELQNNEGGEIPTVIDSESTDEQVYVAWSVHPKNVHRAARVNPNQLNGFLDIGNEEDRLKVKESGKEYGKNLSESSQQEIHPQNTPTEMMALDKSSSKVSNTQVKTAEQLSMPVYIDRENVTKFINEQGFLTYNVRSTEISSYLRSVLKLADILTRYEIYPNANREIKEHIVTIMHDYICKLKEAGKYDGMSKDVLEFKLQVKVFDPFGEALSHSETADLFSISDSDLDRQLRSADAKLGGAGFPNEYCKKYENLNNLSQLKIDCILFAVSDDCIAELNKYAKDKFHNLDDTYRKYIVSMDDRVKRQYNAIISDGDVVSKHSLTLPEDVGGFSDEKGKNYSNHLFSDDNGFAKIKLNGWEEGVLAEEEKAPDFVCWIRNQPRAKWALSIPYMQNNVVKPMYPDFIIIRKDPLLSYVIDILEPHSPDFKDNLVKAKGLAKYAQEEPRIGRIQLIRQIKKDSRDRFICLDFSKGAIREKVIKAQNNEELDHLFDTDGSELLKK